LALVGSSPVSSPHSFADIESSYLILSLKTVLSWISAVDTLAKLHKVDHVAVGLESYGKAKGFYARQIGSLSKVAAAQAAAKDTEGNLVGPIPGLEELSAWFKKSEVQDSTSIVHGDYKVSITEA